MNTIFESMTEALQRGERIEIRGFGTFRVKLREAREGRNPKTGEEVHIPAKRMPFFKVGNELKKMVNGELQEESGFGPKCRGTTVARPSESCTLRARHKEN